jgi:hypothetical protein
MALLRPEPFLEKLADRCPRRGSWFELCSCRKARSFSPDRNSGPTLQPGRPLHAWRTQLIQVAESSVKGELCYLIAG